MAEALVHHFDGAPAAALGDDERAALLGGKGAGLVAMTAAGLPVPMGFTVTTDACRRHLAGAWSPADEAEIESAVHRLETGTGKRLGDAASPLLVSVRSGAVVSMPGMMDTVLDVGMNAAVEQGLARLTGDAAFARDTRCRALRSFAEVVLRVPAELVEECRQQVDPEVIAARLAAAGHVVPDDPFEQIRLAVLAVFESWRSPRAQRYREVEGIDHDLGTAATVQAMVFGNLGPRSGTGVAFTRDPSTGEPGLMGDFLPGAQGEDVVAGDHETLPLARMIVDWPEQYAQLEQVATSLERHLRDLVDLEFTVEQEVLWLLQARRGKRSPIAALRCAVDMAEDPDFPLTRAEAVARVQHLLDDPPTRPVGLTATVDGVVASGLPASPGVATGVLCTDPDEAVERQAAGESVILARRETSPADIHGMAASVGLFTLLGGLVSHAAVVARDWGLPAVVGAAEATVSAEGLRGPGGFVPVGATVTVDGSTGTIRLGAADRTGEIVVPEVEILRRWERSNTDAPTPDPAPPVADPAASFPVLHALRIKGMADVPTLAAITGADADSLHSVLHELVGRGLTKHIEARDVWRLTDDGRAVHATALSAEIAALDLAALPYERFLASNADFKQICTDWQVRGGEPNDHGDAEYDRAVLDRLVALDDTVEPILQEIARTLAWTARYRPRLADALCRLLDGDPKAFTGVLCDSYHDVWMELHEDLILTQGIDRAAEGSG